MSALLGMHVSPRTAAAIIALALGVSVVAGREAPRDAPPPAPPAPVAETAGTPALDLERLERPRLGEAQANLFAPRRAARPVARRAPAAAAPADPVAPPLPFRYLGRYADGGRVAVYVAHGDEPLLAVPGATLAGAYRVEAVSPDAITLTYVPLGTRQRLPIPPEDTPR